MYRWLAFIFVMAYVRMFLFNFVEINNKDVDTSPSRMIKELKRGSYVLGWLLFGNFADNAFDPKIALVLCSSSVGLYYIGVGIYLYNTSDEIERIDFVIEFTYDAVMVVYAGVTAFSMV